MKMPGWITKIKRPPTVKEPEEWEKIIGVMPSITPEQAAVGTPMSEYLAEAISGIGAAPTFAGAAAPAFAGPLAGQAKGVYAEAMRGITPGAFGGALGTEAQAAYREAMAGVTPPMFGGELGAEAIGAYREAMRGEFPEEYYQEAIYKPAITEWREDIMPAIRESYVATGAIAGTEVGERLGKEARRLGEYLGGVKAELGEKAKARAFAAAGMYQTAYQSVQEQTKQRQLIAAGNYQQAYRSAVEAAKARALTAAGNYQQMQLELTKLAYDDYTRRNPAATKILQTALSYLNIPMMAAYQKPEPTGGTWGASIRR